MEQEIKKQKKASKEGAWEYKDRLYTLKGNHSPLTFTLSCKHSQHHPCLHWDEENKVQKEIRYATNQDSCFVKEQVGPVTLGHVVFKDGVLSVPKEQVNLQKLLSLYHPKKDKIYVEENKVREATNHLAWLEGEIEALNLATTLDIDKIEAIMRVEVGSEVNSMSSKELKRDLLMFAKRDPFLFLELAEDENVELRNFAIKAAESGIIKLSQDQRTFKWGSNGKKLMTIPFDENPYSAMAAWFKTDEGVEVYKSIDKKLN